MSKRHNKTPNEILTPIVVHTMGKVGSLSVAAMLNGLNLTVPVLQTHFLSWENIRQVEELYQKLPRHKIPDHLIVSRHLRKMIDETIGVVTWRIITLIRDPVARAISDLFENLEIFLPGIAQMSEKERESSIHGYLSKKFGQFDEAADYVCTWFDQELKGVFGFDIYAEPFERENGYQIYHTRNNALKILAIKLERLNQCYQDAFAHFLGVNNIQLRQANTGRSKWYNRLYKNVIASVSVDPGFLQNIYASRYVRHFYTEKEIESFFSRWKSKLTAPFKGRASHGFDLDSVERPLEMSIRCACDCRPAMPDGGKACTEASDVNHNLLRRDKHGKYVISAIVSTYNAERFIGGCLKNLEAQTIANNLEIIVVDTGSEENEAAIVRQFQQRYDNIQYIRIEKRETVYQAWNRGIRLARGKYVTNANTDDRHRKDALEVLVKTLERNPEFALAYGNCIVTETENEEFENCTSVGRLRLPDFSRSKLLASCIVGPQPVWRRSLHEELGFFDENYRCGADYEFWLRVSQRYNFIHVRDCLGLYLANKNGVSMKGRQPEREMLAIQETYKKRFFTMPSLRSGEEQLFRIIHQLHMDKPCVSIVISRNVSKAFLDDISRLPGLNIHQTDAGRRPLILWDMAVIDIQDARISFIMDLFSNSRIKHIAISGLSMHDSNQIPTELENALQEFGCRRLSSDGPVFEWQTPSAFGMALYDRSRKKEAMAFLEKALLSNPADVKSLNTLSCIALQEGFVNQAEEFALKAARLDRRSIESLMNLITVCAAKGEHDRAAEFAAYILDLDSNKRGFIEGLLGVHPNRNGGAPSSRPKHFSERIPPMRILVVNNLFPPQELGGYGKNMADFVSLLMERGHAIRVLTSDTRCFGQPEGNESHIHRNLCLCGAWDEKGQRLFSRETIDTLIKANQEVIEQTINEFEPDICLAGNIDLLGLPILKPLFERRIPVLHYLGNPFPGYNSSDYPGFPRYQVAAASRWLKQDLISKGYPFQDAEVIYPGAFVQSFKMAVPPGTDMLRIAYAGLVTYSKGPQVLVQALHILDKKGLDFSCSIAGGTINKQFVDGLMGLVEDLGLEKKIIFTGLLNRDGLKDLFAKSNILVFPSLANETFGISQVEAMAAGLLTITSGQGGPQEVIEDGKSGIRFEPGNPAHLAQELLKLTGDRPRWEAIALSGQRRAMKLFDIERWVDKLESVLWRIQHSRDRCTIPAETLSRNAMHPESGKSSRDEIRDLRPIRMQMAQTWLEMRSERLQEAYHGYFGKRHKKIACPQIKSFPLTREEHALVEHEIASLSEGGDEKGVLRHVLAAMLYIMPYQMPNAPDLEKVPDWFHRDYCLFLMESPVGVLKAGEADAYYTHISALIQRLAERIRTEPDSKKCVEMARAFMKVNLAPLYFIRNPLKDLYAFRGEILQYVWNLIGFDLDHVFSKRPPEQRRIRLGIYLATLRSTTEIRATVPVFEYLDREDFEIFLYVSERSGNSEESYCRQIADHFVVLPNAYEKCPKTIRSDDLDILVFGNNTTAGVNTATMLAAHRLARAQCVHFCSPVTTGLRHVDYFLIGSLIDPDGKAEGEYTEKLVRIPGSGICFSMMEKPPKTVPDRRHRRDFGMDEGCVVFASGANFHKITPELRHIWALIIASVPNSVLALYPFGPAWADRYPERLFKEEIMHVFNSYGIDKSRLIILKPFETREHILSFLSLTDIYLDATPYSGATSLLDPLEMAVPPIVTEAPELRFSQGAAMLKELGISDLITGSEKEYVELAVRLGTRPDLRQAKSREIRDKMAQGPPFLDPRAYAEKIGKIFKSIMNLHKAKDSAEPIAASCTLC